MVGGGENDRKGVNKRGLDGSVRDEVEVICEEEVDEAAEDITVEGSNILARWGGSRLIKWCPCREPDDPFGGSMGRQNRQPVRGVE